MPLQLDIEAQRRIELLIERLPTQLARTAAAQLVAEAMRYGKPVSMDTMTAEDGYERAPVSMRQFLEDSDYMGGIDNIWPDLKDDLIRFFDGNYVEGILGGSIGSGKSTFASIAYARMLYELSCLKDPGRFFGLVPGSTIYLINQSVNLLLAKKVLFTEVKQRIKQSPYFKAHFLPNPQVESELQFPKNIIVMPLAAGDTSALGLNVFGGVLDEASFMAVVQHSERAHSVNDSYDAAERMYNSIHRRLTSRFMQVGGKIPGKILIVGSANYEEDFIERKKKEAKTDPRIFVRSKALWESKQQLAASGETFRVEIGGKSGRPRILETGEEADPSAREVIDVPMEFHSEFKKDCISAVRDIAGRATAAIDPFFPDINVLRSCIDPRRQHPFTATQTTLTDGVRILVDKVARRNDAGKMEPLFFPKAVRYAHIDYALSNDECGVAIGCCGGAKRVTRMNLTTGEMMTVVAPIIHIDAMMRIVPPRGGQIDLEGVRTMIVFGFIELGFRIRLVTFDGFQSSEAKQQLQKKNIETDALSVDLDMTPYLTMRQAAEETRLSYYEYAPCIEEAGSLEVDRVRNKVDHPPKKDKGVTDAVAAVSELVTVNTTNFGMGLIDYLKSEKEKADQPKDSTMAEKSKMVKVETNEQTERCPLCESVAITKLSGGSGSMCGQCGHQFNVTAKKTEFFKRKNLIQQ